MTNEFSYFDIIRKTYPEGLVPSVGDFVTNPDTGEEFYIAAFYEDKRALLMPLGNPLNAQTTEYGSNNNLPQITHKPDIYIGINTELYNEFGLQGAFVVSFSDDLFFNEKAHTYRLFRRDLSDASIIIDNINSEYTDRKDYTVLDTAIRNNARVKIPRETRVNCDLSASEPVTMVVYDDNHNPISILQLNISEVPVRTDGNRVCVGIELIGPYISSSDSSLIDLRGIDTSTISLSSFYISTLFEDNDNRIFKADSVRASIDGLMDFINSPTLHRARVKVRYRSVGGNSDLIREYTILRDLPDLEDYNPVTTSGKVWGQLPKGLYSDDEDAIFRKVVSNGETTWIAIGDEGRIVRSVDNGASWYPVIYSLNSPIDSTEFVDIAYGDDVFIAISRDGYVVRSEDDGVSWTPLLRYLGSEDPVVLTAITSNDKGIWCIVGEEGILFISNDNTETWRLINDISNNADLLSVECDNLQTWIVVGTNGYGYLSQDNGENWTRLPKGLIPDSPFDEVSITSVVYCRDEVWLASRSGSTARISEDGGVTWRVHITALNGSSFLAERFYSNKSSVVIAYSDSIAISNDTGESWSALSDGLNSGVVLSGIPSITVNKNDRWMAVFDTGHAATSPPITSIPQTVPSPEWFRKIAGGQNNTFVAIAVGLDDKIIAIGDKYCCSSIDSGETWTMIDNVSPTLFNRSLTAIATDKAGIWIITGKYGVLLRSTDNGNTWVDISSSSSYLNNAKDFTSVDTNNSGVWCVTNSAGIIIRSTNAGVSWTTVLNELSASTERVFTSIVRGIGDIWIATCAVSGRRYRSNNNGATWTEYAIGFGQQNLTGVVFSALATDLQGNWLIVGNNGRLSESTDGFVWTPVAIGGGLGHDSTRYKAVCYNAALELWIASGDNGPSMVSSDRSEWTMLERGLGSIDLYQPVAAVCSDSVGNFYAVGINDFISVMPA